MLAAAHFGSAPLELLAVDCRIPQCDGAAEETIHIKFRGVQSFAVTAEESGNNAWHCIVGEGLQSHAAFELLASPLLAGQNPAHLKRCHHFVFVFYDEYLDVVCESVEAQSGAYRL